ncbi:hypothetical protein ABIF90_008105 [Bradyrhizobium japonicum]
MSRPTLRMLDPCQRSLGSQSLRSDGFLAFSDLPGSLLLCRCFGGKRTSRSGPPVVPGALSTATCSSLPANRGRAIFPPWARNLARASTARQSARRLSRRRKCASNPTGFPARHGISACSALGDRPNRRPPWATRSMRPAIRGAEINKSPGARRFGGGISADHVTGDVEFSRRCRSSIHQSLDLALTTSRCRAARRLGWIGLPGAQHAQGHAGDHARTPLERFEPRTILKSYGLLLLNPNRRDSLRRLSR